MRRRRTQGDDQIQWVRLKERIQIGGKRGIAVAVRKTSRYQPLVVELTAARQLLAQLGAHVRCVQVAKLRSPRVQHQHAPWRLRLRNDHHCERENQRGDHSGRRKPPSPPSQSAAPPEELAGPQPAMRATVQYLGGESTIALHPLRLLIFTWLPTTLAGRRQNRPEILLIRPSPRMRRASGNRALQQASKCCASMNVGFRQRRAGLPQPGKRTQPTAYLIHLC